MNKHEKDDDFANRVSQQLDASITGLDEKIAKRLSASRQHAITKSASHKLPFFGSNWKNSSAFVAASLLIVTASITLFSTNTKTLFNNDSNVFLSADYDVTDDEVIAEYELLNELEFLSWLVEEENENNAS